MKKELFNKIEIPEGLEVTIEGSKIKINGPEGEIKREFKLGESVLEKRDNKIILGHKKATKNEKKNINTITAHIKNMIKGIQKKHEYTLKICSSHFPISVKVDKEKLIIKNFLGEKIDRQAKIPNGVEVEVKKDVIFIKSTNKELAGQTSANFETATKIRGRDKRVFQDGIFIINKDGKEI